MRSYIHGQQHLAARKYHAAIDDLVAGAARESIDVEAGEQCGP